jgi:branched-chain amino acid transport system permease protein
MACLLGLLAMSFDFLANYAGLICLGGAFFHGVGAYVSALLTVEVGLPYYLSIPVGTVLGAVICTAAIYPCLPLRGIYFAVVTLMYPLLMIRLIEALDILGGTEGWHGFDGFPNPWVEAYALVGVILVALFALRRYVTESSGLAIRAVRDNDQAVKASGLSVTWCRTKALFIASLLGCFAGAYFAHMYSTVGISSFALDYSILPIGATVMGGGGTLVGPLVGSLILQPLMEFLREFGSLRIAIFAAILTGVIIFRSEGIISYAARKYQQFERWVEV